MMRLQIQFTIGEQKKICHMLQTTAKTLYGNTDCATVIKNVSTSIITPYFQGLDTWGWNPHLGLNWCSLFQLNLHLLKELAHKTQKVKLQSTQSNRTYQLLQKNYTGGFLGQDSLQLCILNSLVERALGGQDTAPHYSFWFCSIFQILFTD